MALQNSETKRVDWWVIELIYADTCIVLQSHFSVCKAFEPERQTAQCTTNACSPSRQEVVLQPTICPSKSKALRNNKLFRKTMQVKGSINQPSMWHRTHLCYYLHSYAKPLLASQSIWAHDGKILIAPQLLWVLSYATRLFSIIRDAPMFWVDVAPVLKFDPV